MAQSSEVHSYIYIKKELSALGWNVGNPTKHSDGQVYTQNECQQDPIIKKYLGLGKPEYVIVIKDQPRKYAVIEAKPEHKNLEQAIDEAKGYGNTLNADSVIAPIAIAVAGNDEDTYIIKNFYFYKGKWVEVEINQHQTTALLSPDLVKRLLEQDSPYIKDLVIPDDVYYQKATKINEILHNGAINKNNRARVMAALLLAMSTDSQINTSNDAFNLIQEINSKAETVLHKNGKREFAKYISIAPPPTPDNHIKFRRAILDTMQELNGINIKSAMNSGTDILGRFYEQFLKYGNGAKEIGIVLTPRHVTKMAVEALNVSYQDTVFDPACGTGGFLVAAYDHVRKYCSPEQLDTFKTKGIYGIEQDPEVVALALVNMIFRGDGKNNITEGNCFTSDKFKSIKMTKVLMNPPFALKKESEREYKFVDLALERMDVGGFLFVILPISIMFEAGEIKEWRENILLKNNTLLSVITLPAELFYPVGVHTLGVIIQKGIPHPPKQNVLWVRILHDGFIKIKGKRLLSPKEPNDFSDLLPTIQAFVHSPATFKVTNKPEKIKASQIDYHDPLLELVPEAFLDAEMPTQSELKDAAEKIGEGNDSACNQISQPLEKGRKRCRNLVKYSKSTSLNPTLLHRMRLGRYLLSATG